MTGEGRRDEVGALIGACCEGGSAIGAEPPARRGPEGPEGGAGTGRRKGSGRATLLELDDSVGGDEVLLVTLPRRRSSSNSLLPLNASFPSGFSTFNVICTSRPQARSPSVLPAREAAAMSPSSPPRPPGSLAEEKSSCWISRPRIRLEPWLGSANAHERNPFPVHEPS